MLKLFIDSSVFFALCDSPGGASRELFRLALRGQAQLVTSLYVLRETEIHLIEKRSPDAVRAFHYVSQRPHWTIVNPTRAEVIDALPTTPDADDAPIVAAARKAEVDALVTFDRRHLIRPAVAEYLGAVVATPDQILRQVRAG